MGKRAGKRLLARCAMVALASFSLSSAPCSDVVDSIVQAEMARQRIPGVAVGIRYKGQVVQARGYGLANLEWNAPVTEHTIFQSGSIGKQFTAAAVMLLVEDGKLHLADEIGKYLDQAPDTWKGITILHLLTHTSGIGDSYVKLDLRRDYTEAELVDVAITVPVEFPPGQKWSYSNTGYQMLGIILHQASGQFYGDLLHDRVFVPLGMDTARIISEEDIIPQRAAGYRLVAGQIKNQEWVAPTVNTTADGALYLTVIDLLKWDAALAAGQLLKPSSFRAMWTAVRLNDGQTYPYGFGWRIAQGAAGRELFHGGAWQGFQTDMARYVDAGLTVIVLGNLAESDPDRIGRKIAEHYLPELAKAP